MRKLSGKCQCCANHGLAMVVTAVRVLMRHKFSRRPRA